MIHESMSGVGCPPASDSLHSRAVSWGATMRFLCCLLTIFVTAISALGETLRLPVMQDNSIVLVDGEWDVNAGQQGRMRIKGNQHIVAMAFDARSIVGKRIDKATLVCVQGDEDISGVTISTIAAPWDEHRSTGRTAGMLGLTGWGYAGANFPAVVGGNSFTAVAHTPSDLREGVYRWDVPPDAVYAIAIGAAFGLAIHEDDADYGRNPTIFSREQSGKEPYLEVECHDEAGATPAQPHVTALQPNDDDVLQISVTGTPNAFAYDVVVDDVPLGRHNIPFASPGSPQTILVRDFPTAVSPREQFEVKVVARSRTGQTSEAATAMLGANGRATDMLSDVNDSIMNESVGKLPVQRLAVIPVTDKYDIEGVPVGDLPDGYRSNNAIFDGEKIQLIAAAGEVVSFQMLLRGNGAVSVELAFDDFTPRIDWWEAVYVPTDGRRIPDPLLPLDGSTQLVPDQDRSLIADIYVPFDAEPGVRRAAVQLSDGRHVPIEIEVLPFSLPRAATFLCEMNGYGMPESVDQFEAMQKIAYDHRVHANILYYSHHTAAPGARKTNLDMRLKSGKRMDNRRYDDIQPGAKTAYWDDFVEAFGPYLDGSLFKDGHRGPIPAPGFYLSFHESWPLNCRAYYNGDPDAYRAFESTPQYAETYVNVLRDFVALAKSQGWSETGFQVYFNNKGSRGELTKAPWILDEPADYWDYRALKYYGELTDRGSEAAAQEPSIKLDYRIDISRPEFSRGQLAERSDLWIVSSSAFQNYRRLVTDRMHQDALQVWVYGSANHVRESNRDIEAWALDAWSGGASGIVPWQTVNKDGQALVEADQLGLFIFDKDPQGETVIRHSMRLQAFRNAEQLIEYLNSLQARKGWTQAQMSQFVERYVKLHVEVDKTHEADAGTSRYPAVTAAGLDRLRAATAKLLIP